MQPSRHTGRNIAVAPHPPRVWLWFSLALVACGAFAPAATQAITACTNCIVDLFPDGNSGLQACSADGGSDSSDSSLASDGGSGGIDTLDYNINTLTGSPSAYSLDWYVNTLTGSPSAYSLDFFTSPLVPVVPANLTLVTQTQLVPLNVSATLTPAILTPGGLTPATLTPGGLNPAMLTPATYHPATLTDMTGLGNGRSTSGGLPRFGRRGYSGMGSNSFGPGVFGPGSWSGSSGSLTVGNPINAATGNKYQVETDYVGSGLFPLMYMRFYNSSERNKPTHRSAYGEGWHGYYDRSIVVLSSGDVAARRPDGKVFIFKNINGTWTSNTDIVARLAEMFDSAGQPAGWRYYTRANNTEIYDASGRLVSLRDSAGFAQTLDYDNSGRLRSVTDPFGRALVFGYDTDGRVVTLTDPGNEVYRYTYDNAGNLASVTYPDNTSRRYLYEDSRFPHALTGIVDENGSRFATWAYDDQGRAVLSEHAGGTDKVTLAYDDANNTTTVTDANGLVRVFRFATIEGTKKLTSVTATCSGCGELTNTVSYNSDGFIEKRVDASGRVTLYTRDERGLLVSRTDGAGTPLARTITVTWHPVFLLPTRIVFPDRTFDFDYDNTGRLIEFIATAGGMRRIWHYQYNGLGLLASVTGPRQETSSFSYDGLGNLIAVTNPLGHVWHITAYDAYGRPLSVEDPNGLATTYAYDARGRVVQVTVGDRITRYRYDGVGDLSRLVFPDGTMRTYLYDRAHRLVSTVDAVGDKTKTYYDAMGNVIKGELADASGVVVQTSSFSYDPLGRLVQAMDANGQVTLYTYDAIGRLLSVTDPLGHVTQYAYDNLGRLITMTDSAGGATRYTWDMTNHLLAVRTPNGAVTRYHYDGFGDLLKEQSADRGTLRYDYDTSGLLTAVSDARGVTARFSHDALGRITSVKYSESGSDISYLYDDCDHGIGRLCEIENPNAKNAYRYDIFGRVTQQTDRRRSVAYTTRYTYDPMDRITGVTYPDGRLISYVRDALGRVVDVTSTRAGHSHPIVRDVDYRADGHVSALQFGNGITENISYDPKGRVTDQFIGNADTRVYDYDANDNLVRKQSLSDGAVYTYDVLDRLVSENAEHVHSAFSYDQNGNRLSVDQRDQITAYKYVPDTNRLVGVGENAFTLDPAGNTVAINDGAWKFGYNAPGQLAVVRKNGRVKAVYRYNAFGQRVEKIVGRHRTLYHYDFVGRLLSETAPGGNAVRDYVWGGIIPLAQIDHINNDGASDDDENRDEGTESSRVLYLHTDYLGVPRLATDKHQHVVWRWESDAFGVSAPSLHKVNREDGDSQESDEHDEQGSVVVINLRFPGQYFDNETGFYYNGNRYYVPRLGRYLTSDPIGVAGGVNSYVYVSDNPVNNIDIYGYANTSSCFAYLGCLTACEGACDALAGEAGPPAWLLCALTCHATCEPVKKRCEQASCDTQSSCN